MSEDAENNISYAVYGNDPQFTAENHQWITIWRACCKRMRARIDPAGNGHAQGTDFAGNVTHTAVVKDLLSDVIIQPNGSRYIPNSDYNGVPGYWDVPDARTLSETTTRVDSRNRPIATTVWLTPLGRVDPNDVPILNPTTGAIEGGAHAQSAATGLGASDGLTALYYYSEDLSSSSTLTNVYGPDIDLSDLLSKLAADGIDLNDAGNTVASARAVRTPEGRISVSIMDGEGRTVISGRLDPADDHTVIWSATSYDRVSTAAASNYGNTLETMSISALGHINRVRSDAAGRTIQAEDAENNVSFAVYDNAGDAIRGRDANGVGQDCIFDARGRKTSCTDTQGDTTTATYNAENMVLNSTDGKGVAQAADTVFDARGRLLASTTRLDATDTTKRSYDPNGNLLTITDAEGGITTYHYDPRNLRIGTDYPDHVAGTTPGSLGYDKVEVTYDAASRPLVKTDQQGDTVVYLYDLASRMTQRDYRTYANSTDSNSDGIPDGTIADSDTFTYNNDSQTLTATKGRYSNTVTLAYDSIGRKITESLGVNFGTARTYIVGHAYDADNRETATTYPNGKTVTNNYTSRDQLSEVDYDGAMVSQFTYDTGMRETSRTLGNGLDTRREYNRGDNLVTQIINETAPGSADRPDASFAYTYDANKNPTSETTGTGGDVMSGYSYTASYDAKDRLTDWVRTNNIDSQLWSLTHVGDWASTTINGTTQTRTHNAVHEITAITGTSLAHDPKGDLTRLAGDSVDRFNWDFDNKMSSADVNQDGSDDLAFTYDALGRRVSKNDLATGTNTVYVCSGQQVVAEYAANGDPATTAPQQVYVYGSYVDEPLMKIDAANGKLYYHRNRMYCVTALTDSSGNVVERYVYTAYGVTTILAPDGTTVRATSAVGNSYMYTGRRLDKEFSSTSEGAIYYYRARYYIPPLGRFGGRDPMGYVDGWSLYQYVGSGPLGARDALGLAAATQPIAPSGVRLRNPFSTSGETFQVPVDPEKQFKKELRRQQKTQQIIRDLESVGQKIDKAITNTRQEMKILNQIKKLLGKQQQILCCQKKCYEKAIIWYIPGASLYAGGSNILSTGGKPGPTKGTSFLSRTLGDRLGRTPLKRFGSTERWRIWAPTLNNWTSRTTRIGRVASRWAPIIGLSAR